MSISDHVYVGGDVKRTLVLEMENRVSVMAINEPHLNVNQYSINEPTIHDWAEYPSTHTESTCTCILISYEKGNTPSILSLHIGGRIIYYA